LYLLYQQKNETPLAGLNVILLILRATACSDIARLSYRRGVRLTVCLSVCSSITPYCGIKMVQAEIMKFSQLALVSRSVELSKNLEKGTK